MPNSNPTTKKCPDTMDMFPESQKEQSPLGEVGDDVKLDNASEILSLCTILRPQDNAFLNHPIIAKYGSPNRLIYIDNNEVTANGIQYQQPLIMPLYNANMELVDCAVMQVNKPIASIPHGIPKGFAYHGELNKDKPIIITYDIEAFFKVANTTIATVLVVTRNLCTKQPCTVPKAFDFEQIQYVIKQLTKAGYNKLYIPVRPEHINLDAFVDLEKSTAVRLLNQLVKVTHDGKGYSEILIDLSQNDDSEEIEIFFDMVIEQLPPLVYEEPQPLQIEVNTDSATYPLHLMPNAIKQAIQAIHEYIQAPLPMCANSVLFALTFIAQRKVNAVTLYGDTMPCSLYFLTEGESGSRKSTTDNKAMKAILSVQKLELDNYNSKLKQYQKGQGGDDAVKPTKPQLIFSSTTIEPLMSGFIDDEYTDIAIASSDAAEFLCGNSMKSDYRKAHIATLTKFFDAGIAERNRSKSNINGSGIKFDCRLSIHLMAQPNIISETLNSQDMAEIGLLPRSIFVAPKSLAGTRLLSEQSLSKNIDMDARMGAYWKQCKKLLGNWMHPLDNELTFDIEGSDKRNPLHRTSDANKLLLDLYNEIEQAQGNHGKYARIRAYASRAIELITRLSTVFAFFDELDTVQTSHILAASEIVKYSLDEYLSYEDKHKKVSDAELLLEWLLKQKGDIFKSGIRQNAPNKLRNTKILDAALEHLSECGHIRMSESKPKKISINPCLLKSC